jgi:medium-chain acyl-[acyl-carrier-protein] hydrolase
MVEAVRGGKTSERRDMQRSGNAKVAGDSWFVVTRPVERPRLRLFCFPYAGGSAVIFHRWPDGLPGDVEIRALQLPGRSFRLAEPPLPRLDRVLDAIEPVITPLLDLPFAFFGHSMGALIAFELARRLRRRGQPEPACLLMSGRRGPDVFDTEPPICALPEDKFLAALSRRHGAPAELLQNPELIELVMPSLRADFELLETHAYVDEEPLRCPITIFGGKGDTGVPIAHLEAWGAHTREPLRMHLLPGGHFFLLSAQTELLGLLSAELRRCGAADRA